MFITTYTFALTLKSYFLSFSVFLFLPVRTFPLFQRGQMQLQTLFALLSGWWIPLYVIRGLPEARGQGWGGPGKWHLVNVKQTKGRQTSSQLDLTFTCCLMSSASLLLLFDSTVLCAPFLDFFLALFFLSPNVAVKVNGIMRCFWSAAASICYWRNKGPFGVGWLAGRNGQKGGGRRKVWW